MNYKSTIIFSITLIIFSGCSADGPNRGEVGFGDDGRVISGTGKAYCTPPSKRYTNELEATVDLELDGLKDIAKANFEAELGNKIQKLTDYSQKGLDIDLLLYRVCEISINRGFTNEQTSGLVKETIKMWETGKSQTNESIDPASNKKIKTIKTTNLQLQKYFVGEWINIDRRTRGVKRFTLKKSGEQFFINMWGSCMPQDCDWGEVSVNVFAKDVSSNKKTDGIVLGGIYDQKFAETAFTIRTDGEEKLYMENTTRFKDNSGRSNFVKSYEFIRK